MSNSNNDNPKIGRAFQEKVQAWFAEKKNESFVLEYPVHIGSLHGPIISMLPMNQELRLSSVSAMHGLILETFRVQS